MNLFFDSEYQHAFERDGYVVVKLLDPEKVEQILALHYDSSIGAGMDLDFYTSIWSENKEHRKQVDDGLKSILFPALKKILANIQPVFSNFMVKAAGENSALNPHQDWSFVDEPQYESVNAWVPLIDVDPHNGNLQVVPGSHRDFQNYIRPRFAFHPIDRIQISERLVDIPMKAGEAVILSSRLIHASPPNRSNKTRIAASLVVAPDVAPLKHWLMREGRIDELAVDQSFFWEYSCFDKLETLVPPGKP